MVAHGADINCRDTQGRLPVGIASLWNRTDIVEWLQTANQRGWGPMHSAVLGGWEQVIIQRLRTGQYNPHDVQPGAETIPEMLTRVMGDGGNGHRQAAVAVAALACQPLSFRNHFLFSPAIRSLMFTLLLIQQRLGRVGAGCHNTMWLPFEQLEYLVSNSRRPCGSARPGSHDHATHAHTSTGTRAARAARDALVPNQDPLH